METGKTRHPQGSQRVNNEPAEDFIHKQHNDGVRREDIARQYAQQYHRREASQADFEFVDKVLTNVEG